LLDRILDGSLMPHGHCLLWRGDLLFLHLVGDFLTVLAYALIPFAIVYFIHKRDDLHFNWLTVLFAGFIAFCGMTHLVGMINIWHGFYFIEGLIKFLTGLISISTAYILWRLMPSFMKVPSIAMLKQRNQELEAVRAELEEANRTLEAKVKQRTHELEVQANTDTVTGIASRFSIIDTLKQCYLQFQRYQHSFSILMIDIDHFKQINDNYGHQIGDDVLHALAHRIEKTIRKTDSVGRYGGEEFLVILPETESDFALNLAERIRHDIETLKLADNLKVTCSIGVSAMLDGISQDELISRADKALYSAKNTGRNQVISYHKKHLEIE